MLSGTKSSPAKAPPIPVTEPTTGPQAPAANAAPPPPTTESVAPPQPFAAAAQDTPTVNMAKVKIKSAKTLVVIDQALDSGDPKNTKAIADSLYQQWSQVHDSDIKGGMKLAAQWRGNLDSYAEAMFDKFEEGNVPIGDRIALTNDLASFYNGIQLSGGNESGEKWLQKAVFGPNAG